MNREFVESSTCRTAIAATRPIAECQAMREARAGGEKTKLGFASRTGSCVQLLLRRLLS